MKTFEEELEERIAEFGSPDNPEGLALSMYREGFKEGAKWAQTSPELINEILTTYMEWAFSLTDVQVANWEDKEGSFEKTKARIRK